MEKEIKQINKDWEYEINSESNKESMMQMNFNRDKRIWNESQTKVLLEVRIEINNLRNDTNNESSLGLLNGLLTKVENMEPK